MRSTGARPPSRRRRSPSIYYEAVTVGLARCIERRERLTLPNSAIVRTYLLRMQGAHTKEYSVRLLYEFRRLRTYAGASSERRLAARDKLSWAELPVGCPCN